MLQKILLFLLICLAGMQLLVLLFRRRKRSAVGKRLLCTCFAFGLVCFVPVLAQKGLKEVQAVLPVGVVFGQEQYPEQAGAAGQIVYYHQEDPRWGEKRYGPVDLIRDTGCGPTVLAMAVSSFTDTKMTPEEMCRWAYEKGYCSIGSGSYHTLMADGLAAFGLFDRTTDDGEELAEALRAGQPAIALMGEGHFTGSGHFILLCDLDAANQVSVADPKSVERTEKKWDLDLILSEAKTSPVTGGAFWILK